MPSNPNAAATRATAKNISAHPDELIAPPFRTLGSTELVPPGYHPSVKNVESPSLLYLQNDYAGRRSVLVRDLPDLPGQSPEGAIGYGMARDVYGWQAYQAMPS